MKVETLPLEKVCLLITDGTHYTPPDIGEGVPFLTVKDMTDCGLDFSACSRISHEEYEKAQAGNSAPQQGDVLFSKDGTVGKVHVVSGEPDFAVLSSIAILRPDPHIIDSEYLGKVLSTPQTLQQAARAKTGSALRRIILKDLKQVVIPLPPLDEQKWITAVLDKADGIRRKRAESFRLTNEFLKSVFLDMFGDPVTNSKGWKIDQFGNVGELDRGRSRHRPRNAPELLGGPYPLIQTGDVANSDGYIRTYTQTYSEQGLAQSKTWPVGTLCITIAANIAKTAILTIEACFPDSIVGFKPNGKVRTEYIQYWISFLQKILEENAPESAQKNINLEILRALEVPIPPITLQDAFVTLVQKTELSRDKMRDSAKDSDDLFSSLAQHSF